MVTSSKNQEVAHQVDTQALDVDGLVALAQARMREGLAPPPELYLIQHRDRIPWGQFPGWARPSDPDLFDGCCHEG